MAAPSAAVRARIGTSTVEFGTLTDPRVLDPLSGNAVLNRAPVRVRPL
ncbi:MAG TPA: hypothetical protein VGD53_00150 [Actinoallomurus sp.]